MSDLPKGKPILCVDFDGVIHSYSSGWKGPRNIPDDPVPGAMQFLEEAVKHFEVCIYSSRSRYLFGRHAIRNWIRNEFMEFCFKRDFMTCDAPFYDECTGYKMACELVSNLKFPTRKPAAFLQIDDRAITFKGMFPAIEELKRFKPWNKK